MTSLQTDGMTEDGAFNMYLGITCCYIVGTAACWYIMHHFGRRSIYIARVALLVVWHVTIGSLGTVNSTKATLAIGDDCGRGSGYPCQSKDHCPRQRSLPYLFCTPSQSGTGVPSPASSGWGVVSYHWCTYGSGFLRPKIECSESWTCCLVSQAFSKCWDTADHATVTANGVPVRQFKYTIVD